jgi:hypothetical protein
MEEANQIPLSKKGINLLYAIGLAVVIAIIMVLTTTIVFYHSGAYTTVKQIQTGNQYAKSIDKGSLDTTSPINASDIDKYSKSINARLNAIDDKTDFYMDEISDKNLGLY